VAHVLDGAPSALSTLERSWIAAVLVYCFNNKVTLYTRLASASASALMLKQALL